MTSEQTPSFFQHSLHVFVLSGFVFAQPLLQIIGNNVEFLIAQRIEGLELLALVISLSLIFPAMLVFVEFIVLLTSKSLYKIFHTSLIFLLLSSLIVLLLKKFDIAGPTLVAFSLLSGIGLTYCYQRVAITKTYLNILSPAILVFPFLFLSNAQVTKVLFVNSDGDIAPPEKTSNTPVVMVIFDELPMTSLLTVDGEIDALHFPNYARLASDSAWFLNAKTVSHDTLKSVPAILSGVKPKDISLPVLSDYPNNLFTLLPNSYSQAVFEPLTNLCPQSVCQERALKKLTLEKIVALYSDLAVVYAHLILPTDISSGLPDISTNWTSFGAPSPRSAQEIHAIIPSLWGGQRAANFSEFVSSIEKQDTPTLNFIHVLLPHQIWEYLPSGKRYYGPWITPGLSSEQWTENELLVAQGYQRHLLQVQFTDTLIGNLLDKLESSNLYEETLVIVTADHGSGFWPGFSRRALGKEKYPDDLMNVPLFVKLPNGEKKGRYGTEVATTDIIPTIADILDLEISWDLDGKSILSKIAGGDETFKSSSQFQASESLNHKIELFGLSNPNSDFFNIGPHSELINQNLHELQITDNETMTYQLDQIDAIATVDLSSQRFPSRLTGTLSNPLAPNSTLNLALALNNIIVAVTKTYEYNNQTLFSAMIKESQLQHGNNHLTLYSVSEDSGALLLERLGNRNDERYEYFTGKNETEIRIRSADEKPLTISSQHLIGHLDRIEIIDDELIIAGWAIDKEHAVGADYLLLDIEGRLFYATQIDGKRADVTRAHDLPESEFTGFSFAISMDRFRIANNPEVKLLAVSTDGYASEISAGLNISETLRKSTK